jgi:hypothetical protein
MKESGKSSRNHWTVRGTTETCRNQENERSVWLPQHSMKVNWQPHVFQGLGGSMSWVVGLSNNSCETKWNEYNETQRIVLKCKCNRTKRNLAKRDEVFPIIIIHQKQSSSHY